MLGDHASRPMWGRPDQDDSSTAPASQSARVSTPMMDPSVRKDDLFQLRPKLTGFMKEVGQTVAPVVDESTQDDWTPWIAFMPKVREERGRGGVRDGAPREETRGPQIILTPVELGESQGRDVVVRPRAPATSMPRCQLGREGRPADGQDACDDVVHPLGCGKGGVAKRHGVIRRLARARVHRRCGLRHRLRGGAGGSSRGENEAWAHG
jgi:hypothetical protein